MFSRQGQGLVTMSAWSQISNIISQFLCFQMKKLACTISRLPVNVDIYKDEQFINMCFFYGYIIIKQSLLQFETKSSLVLKAKKPVNSKDSTPTSMGTLL